jgi:hypothetical protein
MRGARAGSLTKTLGIVCLACAALVGCADDPEADYSYGAADMRLAALGTWRGVWRPTSGAEGPLTLELGAPASPPRSLQCQSRLFADDALPSPRLQCVATSSLAVGATLTLADGSRQDVELQGAFFAPGTRLDYALLSLESTDGSLRLSGNWQEGVWSDLQASEANQLQATFSLVSRD